MLSFIVPLFNHLAASQVMLCSLLESLPTGLVYEVILVDDASADGTRDWLADLTLPNVRVVFNDQNQGYARTNNRGVAAARGELLCLLNNDLEFCPGWLEPMLALIESEPLRAGVVGNVQHRMADGQLDHAGVYLSQGGAFLHRQTEPLPDHAFDKVTAATGACLLLYREHFKQVGGLDERFINGCEDIDLCYKLRARGLNVLVSYESQIKHHVSLSRGTVTKQNERNSQILFAKWRKEIKQDLAAIWFPKLQAGSGWDMTLLPGALSNEFLGSPHTAARLVAESILCRLEGYWARTLGDAPLMPDDELCVLVSGVERVSGASYFRISDAVVIDVIGLKSARNVYVCGFKDAADEPREILVYFEVNGIQTVVQRLASGQNMNVGVINPLWFSSSTNRISVSFAFVTGNGVLSNASRCVCLTHVVVDDQIFSRF